MNSLFMTLWIIICLVLAVISIAGTWKAFEKAGQPGWACIIPFYNTYIMLKIAGKPGWWLLLFIFLPGINIIWLIWTMNMISKSFGKDEGFTVGLVLLGVIFWPVLGFGDAIYQGPYGDPVAYKAYQENMRVKDGSSLL